MNGDRHKATAAWLAWDGPVQNLASAVMAVGLGWSVVAGWNDVPAAVMIPLGVAGVVLVVMSVREIARRLRQRQKRSAQRVVRRRQLTEAKRVRPRRTATRDSAVDGRLVCPRVHL